MKILEEIINLDPYSLKKTIKTEIFTKKINFLTNHHYINSPLYRKIVKGLKYNTKKTNNFEDLPFLPVRLFKKFNLISIKKNKILKTLVSSGTSGDNLSKIYLDKNNASNQIRVLQRIVNKIIGKKRIPMLIIDSMNTNKDRSKFNASKAAINGFSIFANEIYYALKINGELDYDLINKFLKKNSNQKFLIFGFTSNIYVNLIKKLSLRKIKKKVLDKAILIHGGGWKKLEKMKINNKQFKTILDKKLKIKNVFNYYGLVEQTGSIFFQCKCGYFITSIFSDILIRDENFNIVQAGKKGFLQLFSLLPTSYPGHNILTEDIGEIIEDKKCKCFGYGKRFLVHGRAPEAELRGCSNI